MSENRTRAQESRQTFRDSSTGRYRQSYPCYRCGRNATEQYWSDRRTDTAEFADALLQLCERCAEHLDKLTDAEVNVELDGPEWGKLPRPRKSRKARG